MTRALLVAQVATPHAPQAPQVHGPTFIPSDAPSPTASPTATPFTVESVTTIATLKPQPSPSASPTSTPLTEKHEFPTEAFLIGLVIMIALFAAFFVRKGKK